MPVRLPCIPGKMPWAKIRLMSRLRMQSPRALDLVASGQAVAGPPTPDSVRPRLALPGDGYGADLPRALSTPHQVRFFDPLSLC